MSIRKHLLRALFCLSIGSVSACAGPESSPLFFGQGLTVGISVGASPANQTVPEMTIGLKQANIAIVPTVIPKDVPIDKEAKSSRKILAFGSGDKPEQDALSTFGSFSAETKVDNVTLGVFFATGVAAQNLSRGFGCGVSDGNSDVCHEKQNEEDKE